MGLSTVDRVLAAREASNVRRGHVVPHVNLYTVGKHAHDCLSLLFILHPEPSIALIKALHWHDAGERWVGDLPAPAKWWQSGLGEVHGAAEQNAVQAWELYEGFPDLEEDDYRWLRAIDSLELWLWCQDELAMGNRHVQKFKDNLDAHFQRVGLDLPEPVQRVLREFEWRRLPEKPEAPF